MIELRIKKKKEKISKNIFIVKKKVIVCKITPDRVLRADNINFCLYIRALRFKCENKREGKKFTSLSANYIYYIPPKKWITSLSAYIFFGKLYWRRKKIHAPLPFFPRRQQKKCCVERESLEGPLSLLVHTLIIHNLASVITHTHTHTPDFRYLVN